MPTRSSKRPRDVNQLAKHIVDIATDEARDIPTITNSGKNAAAVALGRLGGKRGGKARAAKLSPEERSRIARLAAVSRWKATRDE